MNSNSKKQIKLPIDNYKQDGKQTKTKSNKQKKRKIIEIMIEEHVEYVEQQQQL